jgi:hypothetical protein
VTRLFNRVAELRVDDLVINDLHFVFSVERTLRASAGKADIKIHNLNPDHRGQLERLGSVPVVLTAGYEEGVHQIFKGDIRPCTNTYTQPDWITTIKGADGGRRRRTARTSRSFRPGTTLETVLSALAQDLGLGRGNVAEAARVAQLAGAQTEFIRGAVLDGNAMEQLTALCRSIEYEVSVQNGALQLLPLGRALAGSPLELDSDSGLIGTIEKDSKGKIKFKTQMIPDLFPGRLVAPQSRTVQGGRYRVTKCTYKGDTRGQEWGVDCEAEPS